MLIEALAFCSLGVISVGSFLSSKKEMKDLKKEIHSSNEKQEKVKLLEVQKADEQLQFETKLIESLKESKSKLESDIAKEKEELQKIINNKEKTIKDFKEEAIALLSDKEIERYTILISLDEKIKELKNEIDFFIKDSHNEISREKIMFLIDFIISKAGVTAWGLDLKFKNEDYSKEITWLVINKFLHTYMINEKPKDPYPSYSLNPEKTRPLKELENCIEEYNRSSKNKRIVQNLQKLEKIISTLKDIK